MEIGYVTFELRRKGDKATLLLTAKPFSHETPITFTELEQFALYLAAQVGTWRDEQLDAERGDAQMTSSPPTN